jgi:hypothetical protein
VSRKPGSTTLKTSLTRRHHRPRPALKGRRSAAARVSSSPPIRGIAGAAGSAARSMRSAPRGPASASSTRAETPIGAVAHRLPPDPYVTVMGLPAASSSILRPVLLSWSVQREAWSALGPNARRAARAARHVTRTQAPVSSSRRSPSCSVRAAEAGRLLAQTSQHGDHGGRAEELAPRSHSWCGRRQLVTVPLAYEVEFDHRLC